MKLYSHCFIIRKKGPDNIVETIRALQATVSFENSLELELKNEYTQYIGNKINLPDKEYQIKSLPKIKGCISKLFEEHLGPYIDKEGTEMRKSVFDELKQEIKSGSLFEGDSKELGILCSATSLFRLSRFFIERLI